MISSSAAEADASQVVFRYDGVLGLSLDATAISSSERTLGDLRDGRPVVVQEGTLPREGATGRFILQKGCAVGFGLPDGYDPMRPGSHRSWNHLLHAPGQHGEDYIEFCTIDTSGNYVVVGATSSPDFPSTAGTYDPVGKVNVHKDAFIGLFNRTGWLLSSTFIAGSSEEENNDMRVGSGRDPVHRRMDRIPRFPHYGRCEAAGHQWAKGWDHIEDFVRHLEPDL